MNVIIAKQKFLAMITLFTYPFQSLAIVRICFEEEIYAETCLKVRNFS